MRLWGEWTSRSPHSLVRSAEDPFSDIVVKPLKTLFILRIEAHIRDSAVTPSAQFYPFGGAHQGEWTKNGCLQASRCVTSQNAKARQAAAMQMNRPVSIPWNVQKRLSG
jgi:hypothetical protein